MAHRLTSVVVGLLFAAMPSQAGNYGCGYSTYYPTYTYAATYTPSYQYYPAQGSWPAGYYAYVNGYWAYYPGYQAPAATVPAYSADWRTAIIKAAAARDDQITYLKAINALGFAAPSAYPLTPGYAAVNYGSYGVNGQTVYGQTYETIRQAYGDTNMNVLYQQAARLGQGAQSLAGQATDGFQSLVASAGTNQARIAEILARAQSASTVLQATAPQASTTTATRTTTVGTGQAVVAETEVATDTQTFIRTHAQPLCGQCHTGADAKGKFNILEWNSFTPEQKDIILERVTTTDESKRMPRGAADKPGPRLTARQIREFARH